MLMRLGDGTPRFEIRNSTGEELLFKVYGEKMELQQSPDSSRASSLAGVTAIGNVRFTGPGVEGTCNQLSILSGTGEVLLKGNIHMKTKKGKTWSELTAEKMIYQIGYAALLPPGGASRIAPASYTSPHLHDNDYDGPTSGETLPQSSKPVEPAQAGVIIR